MTEPLETPALVRLRQRRPRVLITNDDGINAPGMTTLVRIAHALTNDVWLVAPESEQSGASHSLTLHIPIRMRQTGDRRFAVLGTPTDCVMMGVKHIIEAFSPGDARMPDLVLSGVNRGSNIAEDVTYSGTVAGAMEGCTLGIPSIALSQSFGMTSDEPRWSVAEHHGPALIAALLEAGWPRDVLLNVNFPDRPHLQVEGIEITRQGRSASHGTRILERKDARGVPYYWLGFERARAEPPMGTDLHAIRHGRISVTPLHLNLTYDAAISDLKDAMAAPAEPPAPQVHKHKKR